MKCEAASAPDEDTHAEVGGHMGCLGLHLIP